MAKTKNAFLNHVSEIKKKTGFIGVITHGDYDYLYRLYMLTTLAVFKEECTNFFNRKREEN